MKHLVIGQCQKAHNFSAFHWSPHGSLVSIDQRFVTTSIVHLPKRTNTSVITESDQSGPNHQAIAAMHGPPDLDQAVRTAHSCNSWLSYKLDKFLFQNNLKYLDPSYKVEIDLRDCFGRKKNPPISYLNKY